MSRRSSMFLAASCLLSNRIDGEQTKMRFQRKSGRANSLAAIFPGRRLLTSFQSPRNSRVSSGLVAVRLFRPSRAPKHKRALAPMLLFLGMVRLSTPETFSLSPWTTWRGSQDPDRLYYARTDEASALDSKPPYREVRIKGNVEGRFIFGTVISRQVLPFAMLAPLPVLLPLEESNGSYYTMTTQMLKRKGFLDFAKWMKSAETIWDEMRGVRVSHTLLQWLDYSGKLTSQAPRHRHLVLYNATGTNVSATYCDRKSLDLRLVIDHKLYWAAFSKASEAYYVTAILNSASANDAIKPFQSTGLLGERDIHKKLLDIPMPRYDPANEVHRRLSELGSQAHKEAQTAIKDLSFPPSTSLARQRAYIRTALEDTLSEIDELVRALLKLGS